MSGFDGVWLCPNHAGERGGMEFCPAGGCPEGRCARDRQDLIERLTGERPKMEDVHDD